ncbi:retinoblastoma-binding protein, partial [Chrysochromulina tobinii]
MAQYKFKSSNDTFSVKFDGPHIPLIELREKIVAEQKIVKGKDLFVLELSNAQTGEVYEENALIPRNTAVLVKRVPQLRREAIVGTAVDEEGAEPLQQYIKQKGECPSCRVNWQANGTKVLPNRSLREAVLKAQEAAAEA